MCKGSQGKEKTGKRKDPPCGTCDYGVQNAPPLMPENFEAWELWQDVGTQWRAGPAGLIGLDYSEVRAAAEMLDIDLSPGMWRKIKKLEGKVLES